MGQNLTIDCNASYSLKIYPNSINFPYSMCQTNDKVYNLLNGYFLRWSIDLKSILTWTYGIIGGISTI